MYLKIENFKDERWSARSDQNEILKYGTLQECETYIMNIYRRNLEKKRESNINKSGFNRQKQFITSPIGGHIKN